MTSFIMFSLISVHSAYNFLILTSEIYDLICESVEKREIDPVNGSQFFLGPLLSLLQNPSELGEDCFADKQSGSGSDAKLLRCSFEFLLVAYMTEWTLDLTS